MIYRALEPEEYGNLQFIFGPRGIPLPEPVLERVAVAEDSNKIVGMVALRLLPLVDALWAEPLYRGGRIDYQRMVSVAEQPLRKGCRSYALVRGKHVSEIAWDCGYRPTDLRLMQKEF